VRLRAIESRLDALESRLDALLVTLKSNRYETVINRQDIRPEAPTDE